MARLYPPVTEETLPAFCLTYNDKGEKVGATIKINFQMNQAVASSEITGIALRLRTISTNDYVVTESLEKNPAFGKDGLSEGFAMDYDLNEGVAIFSITNEYNPLALEKLRVGQYYKAQLAYIGLDGNIGYWSVIAAIKCVAQPYVTINGYKSNDVNIFSNEIIGNYQQDISSGDTTEKVYSYKFTLYDTDGDTIYDETEVLIHNSSNDESNNLSKDIFYCYKELEKNKIYYLVYEVTTINGLKVSSPIYQVTNIGSIPPEDDIGLFAFNGTESNYPNSADLKPFEEGVIKLYIDFNTASDRLSRKTITGNFVITRSSSKDNFTSWQEVRRFRLAGIMPSSKIIYDYTVEQGISYRYAVQQFNRQSFYSDKVYAYERDKYSNLILNNNGEPIIKEIKADFEDMFLYDGKRQLKIRFNPKVNSLKNDLQEQKVDTIGSKYPFIFRNGNVCYKEFPISGLISFQQDNAFLFISDEDYNQMNLQRFETSGTRQQALEEKYIVLSDPLDKYTIKDLYKKEIIEEPIYEFQDIHEDLKFKMPISSKTIERFVLVNEEERSALKFNELYKRVLQGEIYDIDRSQTYSKTDLTSENIASERYFKLSVLDWLTNGKPKLFRSPTEGNYIVRLLNVSLSPSEQLGRMLHTFSCTAYEIADFNYNSLKELGLLTVTEQNTEVEYEWFTTNIETLFNSEELVITNEDGEEYYNIDIGNNELFSFECINFAPGDKIKIITEDNPIPITITIGQSGTYIYEDGSHILKLSICPSGGWGGFSRDISLRTKGYKYRPFDMIASINLHTQYGEQIVGKMNNFFAPTVVQTENSNLSNNNGYIEQYDNYYTRQYDKANNVNLVEKFVPIPREEMSQELFNSDIFYILNTEDDNNKYKIAPNYIENITYFQKIVKGAKLVPFDLLYLHAKKREVIPIFTSFKDVIDIVSNKDSLITATFSLTPTGNGYVKYSSVCTTQEWLNTTNLTQEQREKAYSVQDLVDLTFSQVQNLDQFCLFELYVPKMDPENSISYWIPYATYNKDNAFNTVTGIFDPYLYRQLISDPSIKKPSTQVGLQRLGWWQKDVEGKYDPSFIISYGNAENKKTEYFSLQDDNEITLKNLDLPSDLSTNNGIVVELIYRIKYIDYTIEAEDHKLQELKNLYNITKQKALNAIREYRFAEYGTLVREALMNQPDSIASRLNLSEDYQTILYELTNRIRIDQIEKIQKFLKNESNLILNLTLELKYLSNSLNYDNNIMDLLEPIGIDNKSVDGTYMHFIQNSLTQAMQNQILPPIDSYTDPTYIIASGGTVESAIQKATQEITNTLNYYLKNQDNNIWDFKEILNSINKSISEKRKNKKDILVSMGSVRYVSQYIDLLTQNKVTKFFDIINPEIDGEPIYSEPSRIGDLLNKKSLPEGIEKKPVQYIDWEEYFHINDSDNEYLKLGALQEQIDPTTDQIAYHINNLEKYSNSMSGKLFTNKLNGKNYTLLQLISNGLDDLNTNFYISSTKAYEQKYKVSFNINKKPFLLQDNNDDMLLNFPLLQVCNINSTDQLIKQSDSVETVLDDLFLQGSISNNMKNEELKQLLKELFNTNQNKCFDQIPDCILQNYVNILVDYYITSGLREIYQKAYTYQVYYNNYNSNFTQSQADYLLSEINNLIINIKSKNNALNNALNSFKQQILDWKKDWENTADNSLASEKKIQINNYINTFNIIIEAKNTAIQNYKNIQREIKNLQSPDSNIQMSDNIREKYWEEWQAYDDAIKQIEQLTNIFQETYNQLQKENYIVAYPEFIKDYLLNYNYDKDDNIDNEYQEYIQQINEYSYLHIDEAKSIYNQREQLRIRWAAFLNALANKYKKMS